MYPYILIQIVDTAANHCTDTCGFFGERQNSPFILRHFDDDVYEPLPANNSCLLMGISS